MPLSLEATARLQAIRQAVLSGTSTREMEKEGIMILRQDRQAAQVSSTKSRTAKAEAARPVDTAAALANLKALGAKLMSGPVA
jgi:hypothetical protein